VAAGGTTVTLEDGVTELHLPTSTSLSEAKAIRESLSKLGFKNVIVGVGNDFNIDVVPTEGGGEASNIHLNDIVNDWQDVANIAKDLDGAIVSYGSNGHINLLVDPDTIFFSEGTTPDEVKKALAGVTGFNAKVKTIGNASFTATLASDGTLKEDQPLDLPETGYGENKADFAVSGAFVGIIVAGLGASAIIALAVRELRA
jgi:hypothetical protein